MALLGSADPSDAPPPDAADGQPEPAVAGTGVGGPEPFFDVFALALPEADPGEAAGSAASLFRRGSDREIVEFTARLSEIHAELLAYGDARAADVGGRLAALSAQIGAKAAATESRFASLASLLDGYAERWKQMVVHHDPAEVFAARAYTPVEFAREILDNVLPLLDGRAAPGVTDGAVRWIEYGLLELAGQGAFDDCDAFYDKVKEAVKGAGTRKQYRLVEHLVHAIHVETLQAQSQYRSSLRSFH
jgi:hypothetical protein